jgi:hypothetical protein
MEVTFPSRRVRNQTISLTFNYKIPSKKGQMTSELIMWYGVEKFFQGLQLCFQDLFDHGSYMHELWT